MKSRDNDETQLTGSLWGLNELINAKVFRGVPGMPSVPAKCLLFPGTGTADSLGRRASDP